MSLAAATGQAADEELARRAPVRIFRAESMPKTPFDEREPPNPVFVTAGVVYVDKPKLADIIVARMPKPLTRFGRWDKPFAIWTHEPFLSRHFEPVIRLPDVRNAVHVMNAYTGGIYADEFYEFRTGQVDLAEAMRAFAEKPRRAVMLASYRKSRARALVINGVDHDLNRYRQDLALYLKRRGFCDIYGRKWPADAEIAGNSREGNWHVAKMEILKGYAVNLAFENTIIPNYVTEKIWDAIFCGCLPVYHGARNGIYRIFPRDSFIEAEGMSAEELGDRILAMSKEEMTARYEACVRAYISVQDGERKQSSRRACHIRTVRFLEAAIEAHAVEKRQRKPTMWRRLAARVFPGRR